MNKITFGKSEPYKSGWKGWADFVEVYCDGRHIGFLHAQGCDQRRHMEYRFTDRLSFMRDAQHSGVDIHVSELGLRAAKQKLIETLRGRPNV